MDNRQPLILVVDDFADALEMYQQFLTFRGYRVAVAESGPQALTRARSGERPALILLDIQMLGMTGIEVMQTLRRDAAFTTVPIVAFTAHAHHDEREQMLSLGFDAVIGKPCLPDDLAARVGAMLRNGRSARSSATS